MTATVHSIGQSDPTNHTISRTMESLRVYRGMTIPELQHALGLKPGTYFNRKRGTTDWTAAEVKRAADALHVSVTTLYDGLLPHVDSNHEPTGLQQAATVTYLSEWSTAA